MQMRAHRLQHTGYRSPLTLCSRRGAIKVSPGGALAALVSRRAAANPAQQAAVTNDKSVIVLWLEEGPYQYDSFDPKENISELATKFRPICTSATGVQFAECLPELARQGKHIAVIRSMVARKWSTT